MVWRNLLYNLFQKQKVGENVMKLLRKPWLIPLVSLLLTLGIPKGYCEIGVNLYPSKGTIFTDILLEAYVPINSRNNIFWDDVVIALDVPRGQENFPLTLNIKCPNQHPYSDLGNHTITVESFYWDGSDKVAYGYATFEIVEYFPCDEWLVLNATYHDLLANYSDLTDDYNSLLADYNALQADYNTLQNDYNSLLANYNNLLNSYNSLASNYDSLNSNYYELKSNFDSLNSTYHYLLELFSQLQSDYSGLEGNYDAFSVDLNTLQALYTSLLANYTHLQNDYDSVCSNYNTLEVDYNSLNSDYDDLQSKQDTLMSDLSTAKNLSYIFIITTIIFIGIAIYLAVRKPKKIPTSISEV
jgi:hypothetical protein